MQRVLSFLVPVSWITVFILGSAGFGSKVAAAARGEDYSTSPYLYASLIFAVVVTVVAFRRSEH